MQISPNGLALIKRSEGFAAHVYSDNGKWAVGYGHDLLPGESFPTGVTEEQAEALLLSDLEIPQMALTTLVPAYCSQNQWDALCDFAYNLGVGSLRTMLAHGWAEVPAQIPRWDNENGQPNTDLQARRALEVALFNQA